MRIAINGFGRIGRKLIKRCLGFEMQVYVYDPFVDQKTIESFGGIKVNNLNDDLKETDILSLSVPLTEKIHNMINLEKIKSLDKITFGTSLESDYKIIIIDSLDNFANPKGPINNRRNFIKKLLSDYLPSIGLPN